MELTYDPDADAAYVRLVEHISPGEAATQVGPIPTPDDRGEIIVDFDRAGNLLGFEILGAREILASSLLRDAPLP